MIKRSIILTANLSAKIWTDNVEPSAMEQITGIINHPCLFHHVAIMPDVHAGKGATIGSVIPLTNAIIPSAVGVDIGCGMVAVKTSLRIVDLQPQIEKVHHSIQRSIPTGYRHRGDDQLDIIHQSPAETFLQWIQYYEKDKRWNQNKIINQLGTLGGGNHFIELQSDGEFVWIMVHSGSRNIGKKIADTYIDLAKKVCRETTAPDLEFFDADSLEGQDYIQHQKFALEFAFNNRMIMVESIKKEILYYFSEITFEPTINIHHNYVQLESHYGQDVWVHRKGATRVTSDIIGIIPGSMGSPSYLVKGTDNAESYNSCSHGAGRKMSRTVARGKMDRKTGVMKTTGVLTLEDFKSDMNGVFTTDVDLNHLDEAPRAYKDIDKVMEDQKDLVVIIQKLLPIMNIKGS
jgi:tRNA-splicing ligase RtcB (3'-phosphate/5'-hydroxy nucleic acid ligase)